MPAATLDGDGDDDGWDAATAGDGVAVAVAVAAAACAGGDELALGCVLDPVPLPLPDPVPLPVPLPAGGETLGDTPRLGAGDGVGELARNAFSLQSSSIDVAVAEEGNSTTVSALLPTTSTPGGQKTGAIVVSAWVVVLTAVEYDDAPIVDVAPKFSRLQAPK